MPIAAQKSWLNAMSDSREIDKMSSLVGLFVITSQKAGKLHFNAPIGECLFIIPSFGLDIVVLV